MISVLFVLVISRHKTKKNRTKQKMNKKNDERSTRKKSSTNRMNVQRNEISIYCITIFNISFNLFEEKKTIQNAQNYCTIKNNSIPYNIHSNLLCYCSMLVLILVYRSNSDYSTYRERERNRKRKNSIRWWPSYVYGDINDPSTDSLPILLQKQITVCNDKRLLIDS